MKKVSLQMIADSLGVSKCTVSLVLSGKSQSKRVSEELSRRILAKAKELNYQPNELARSFAEFRIFNEGKCAALAAQKRTDKDMQLLRDCLEAIEAAEDIEVFAKEITNLHHYIFNASGNKLYAVVFGAFRPVIENWNHYLFSDWKSYDSSAIKAIVNCIENRDAVAAECAMTVYTTESLVRISRLRHMEIEKKNEDLRILD